MSKIFTSKYNNMNKDNFLKIECRYVDIYIDDIIYLPFHVILKPLNHLHSALQTTILETEPLSGPDASSS